jgi:WD40 repeat protein
MSTLNSLWLYFTSYVIVILFHDNMFISIIIMSYKRFGHKLPVFSMDISDDSTVIVTGSADKTIKVWGLDFGDCHRSLLAHSDIVTSVAFVPRTHYVFTTSKDKTIKFWDIDHFEKVRTWTLVLKMSTNMQSNSSHVVIYIDLNS